MLVEDDEDDDDDVEGEWQTLYSGSKVPGQCVRVCVCGRVPMHVCV